MLNLTGIIFLRFYYNVSTRVTYPLYITFSLYFMIIIKRKIPVHSPAFLIKSFSFFFSLSVRYGRRFAMLLSLALQTVFGVAAAFAPNFPVYVTLRFIIGMTVSGVIINAFVLGETWSTKVTH